MKNAIDVRSIVKKFGDFTAVDGISFAVEEGEIFGLLGPNGAGKSTLIRMLVTLLPPTAGTALVGGFDIIRQADDVRRTIGVIPQAMTSDLELSVEENLIIYSKLYGVPREKRQRLIPELLEAVELLQWRDKPVKNLSGGMRRRVEIARGLVHGSGVSFDEAWTRVKAGRPYAKEKTGLIRHPTSVGGVTIDNIIEVPAEYDAARKWPLRVQLHGGVGRDLRDDPQPQSARIPGEPQIYIEPQAYWEAAWWHTSQVDNILGLLDFVRRKYNVDETQTYITGISDGGTGTFFFALREPSPWAACLSLNGQPLVLANRDARIEGNLYLGNLANCPLYIVNGDHDPLYPAETVTPIVDAMVKAGVMPVYHIQPNERHDVHWWPEERASYEMFVHTHPRPAHPERLSWETDRTDRFNRVRWLVIDKLGTRRPTPPALEDVNVFSYGASKMNIFPRRRQVPSGRVDVERLGNAFRATTRGVSDFTLLVSPDVVDFAKPVQVTVNGARVFSGPVKKDVATLLKWASCDNDRTALYGAELHVTVPN